MDPRVTEAWQEKYTVCRRPSCGKPVSDGTFADACRRFQQQLCSVECYRADLLDSVKCCDKAQLAHCVCSVSTECPDHGRRCHGTHD